MDRKILIMKKLALLLIVIPAFFVSCEQDADVELPKTEPELVISCFVMPQDSFIRVKVTLSAPVFGNGANVQSSEVTNATVTLFGNNTSIVLPYNANEEFYKINTAQFQIQAGSEYRLEVTDTEGRHAIARTQVPLLPPIGFNCIVEDSVEYSDPNYEYGRSVYRYSVQDFSGGVNYYRFCGYTRIWNSSFGDSLRLNRFAEIFSDNSADGEILTGSGESWYQANLPNDSIMGYEVWMLNCNYDYYNFHNSLYNNQGGDPFSEPTLMYTNVEGGLGIFAAANAVKLILPR